jgi:hypothetical protein
VNAAPGDRDAQAIPRGPVLPGDPPALAALIRRARAAEQAAQSGDGLPEDWPQERPP